jgi:hypothetical protein
VLPFFSPSNPDYSASFFLETAPPQTHFYTMRILLPLLLILTTAGTDLFAQRYDVVIHEIFADPSPSVGLPASEWIEIRNRSNAPIPLQGWRLSDATGQSGPLPNITLQPDSLLILCSPSAVAALSPFGRTVGLTSFPSLDNDGEVIVLRNAAGQVVHAIDYSVQWHATALKKEGGWSLEMIDPAHPGLFQPNWTSSVENMGGTPGKPNSVERALNDLEAPILMHGYALDTFRLLVFFNEALDSNSISQEGLFHLSDNREIVEARCLPPLYDRVELRTDWPLLTQKVYTLTNIDAIDVNGNHSNTNQSIRIGIPSTPDTADIKINEILFDPPAGGSDYVEILNIGKKIIDLSRLFLSSRSPNSSLGSIQRIRNQPLYFFPGDHLVLTEDLPALERNYFVQHPNQVIHTTALPSLPDAEGSLVVLNAQGEVVDELSYADDWHFPRLQSRMGVALERIDPRGVTQNRNNWQSAAGTVGYGTPTRQNSQYRSFLTDQQIELSSAVISPNGDGREDLLQLRIQNKETAGRVRIRVFHSTGSPVRELANMTLMGTESVFSWDGLDNSGRQLPGGQYILLTEITDNNGRTIRYKNLVALTNG